MKIKLTVGTWENIASKLKRDEIVRDIRWMDKARNWSYEVNIFNDAELEVIVAQCESSTLDPNALTVIKKIKTHFKIKANPSGKTIRKLEEFEEALREYLRPSKKHWVFTEQGEFILPFVIISIHFHPAERSQDYYKPAYVSMRGVALKRGHKEEERWSWFAKDVVGKTIPDILDEEKIYFAMDELMDDYELQLSTYKQIQPLTGNQYVGIGLAEVKSCEDSWRSSYSATSLIKDGVQEKLVLDDLSEEGGKFGDDKTLTSTEEWGRKEAEQQAFEVPVHPFVKVFGLEQHEFLEVHVEQLTPYKWSPTLGDKLILPAGAKEIIAVLMNTAGENLDDIIQGKSGGTIVICTGPPGTGKTLTAEVTSEVIQRPIYKVQCSQLGTDEENIEAELKKVLARAERWKALLLIDEADVYVRCRDNDIQQNAIVGVFLRVLEYYRGVLFLTSNMATVIDDAIMSRATAHLRYALPSASELKSIWMVLSEQFGCKLTAKAAEQLASTFPKATGRDVKALLKLALRYSRNQGCEVNLELFKKLAPHKDVKEEKFE